MDAPRSDGAPAACPPGTWCWVNPIPNGNRVNALHGPSDTELYAAGEGGTLLRFDGASWLALEAGTSAALYALFTAAGKVVAVGAGGTIVEGDGNSFKATVLGKEDLLGLHGCADELYAVGAGNTVLRAKGGSWTTLAPPDTDKGDLNAVFCPDASAPVLVAGEKGRLYRYDRASATWSSQVVGSTSTSHRAIWGSGATLFLGGSSGSIQRSTDGGQTWSSLSLSNFWDPITALWGSGPGEVYLVGGNRLFQFDGLKVGELATVTLSPELRALFGAGGALYLGGGGGALLRYKQGALQAQLPTSTLTPRSLRAVHGRNATEVLAVGEGGVVLLYNGSTWKKLVVPESGGANLNGLYSAPGGPTFVVGDGGKILRHQSGQWSIETSPTTASLSAVWAADAKNAVAVGGDSGKPVLVHLEGGSWTIRTVPTGVSYVFDSVWGSSAKDVYAVAYGAVVRYDGTKWTLIPKTTFKSEPTRVVWGRGPTEVYVATDWGNLWQFDGVSWTSVDAGMSRPRAIAGDAKSILIALEGGEIVRGVGAGWVREVTHCGNPLTGIWLGPSGSFAVGELGTILQGGP